MWKATLVMKHVLMQIFPLFHSPQDFALKRLFPADVFRREIRCSSIKPISI